MISNNDSESNKTENLELEYKDIIWENKDELSNYHSVMFILIYSMVFLLSLIGNLIILIIICRRKRMRTVNNFFLANITISNLIYTLCAPFPFIIEINNKESEWIFYDFMCPIIPLLNTVAINLNTITMIVSSVDRLIVIMCPFRIKLSKRKCISIISLIWFISIVFSLPWSFLLKVQESNSLLYEEDTIDYEEQNLPKLCIPLPDYTETIQIYFILLCFLQYLLPLVVLCITYSMITYYINVINAKNIQNDENKSNNFLRKKNEKKVNLISFFFVLNT